MGGINERHVYSKLAEIIAAAQQVAHDSGDSKFENELRHIEVMTLDRLYSAMDGMKYGNQRTRRKQGR